MPLVSWIAECTRRTALLCSICSVALPLAPAHAAPPTASGEPSALDGSTTPTESAPPSEPSAAPIDLGDDEVELVNGGFVRGTVIEAIPNERVVIVDGSGTRREIPWEQVAQVRRDKYAAAATPTPEPAPVPATPEVGLGRPRVHLVLSGTKQVNLYEVNDEIVASGYGGSVYGMNFRSVCAAPCDRVVDGTRGQDFFLSQGSGTVWTASRRFGLSDRTGDVTIEVKPGSKALRIVGAVLVGFGLGFAIAGGILAIPKFTRTPGLIMLAGGAPVLIAGIPMMVLGRTRYRFR